MWRWAASPLAFVTLRYSWLRNFFPAVITLYAWISLWCLFIMSARSKKKPASMAEHWAALCAQKTPEDFCSWSDYLGCELVLLIYQLFCEVEKPENFKVLFGKKHKHEVSPVSYGCAVLIHRYTEYIRRDEDQRLQADRHRVAARHVRKSSGQG